MSTIVASGIKTISLPEGYVLTVTADADSTGDVYRLADSAGDEPQAPTSVAASSAPTFGPFAGATRWQVACLTGALIDSQAPLVGFANPMTAEGEMLVGGVAGAAAALANPGAGTFNLQSIDGVLTWTAAV